MPLNIDWQQILLHLFNFVILFAVLYFLLYKPVKQFMDERTEYYKNLDDEAKANLAESEKVKAEYTERLSQSEAEIAKSKEIARKELAMSIDAQKKQAENEAAKIIADARITAQREREKILKEAQGEIADMVTTATEKIVLGSGADAFDQFFAVAQRGESDE
ncbi:MAG: ATP synthase F0 subunit B [Ruminococcus sp.]|nr:ATP synthase F0 subunit B [Ruminococcus sp.]